MMHNPGQPFVTGACSNDMVVVNMIDAALRHTATDVWFTLMLAVLTFQRPRRFVGLVGARLLHVERVYVPDSRWPDWQVIIGIELHAQLKSRRKLFSSEYLPLAPCLK
jgi:hypothetical protein